MSIRKAPSTSKKNGSIIHGVFAKDVLLPWDDPDEFAALHDGLKEEFFPSGTCEEECVLDLALLHWQKRTLWRLRTATVLSDPFTDKIAATGRKSWRGIRGSLKKSAREDHTLRASVEASIAEGLANIVTIGSKMVAESSPVEAAKSAALFNASAEVMKESLLPLLQDVKQLPDAETAFAKNYSTEDLEKVLRLEAQVDARITKVSSRLVALKEFKRTPAGNPAKLLTAARPAANRAQTSDWD